MQKILKSTISNKVGQNFASNSVVSAPNVDNVRQWLNTLQSKANTTDSKGKCIQLASVINYYNRKSQVDTIAEVNWQEWNNQIATTGLVDKVKINYEKLMSERYDVSRVAESLATQQSQDLSNINRELAFHAAMWMNNYCDYQNFLFELEEYGDSNYLMHENYDFFYGLEADLEELTETHNYIPGSKDDVNIRGYYTAQFNWGKKVISYFRHPGDDFKAAQATKNILGR